MIRHERHFQEARMHYKNGREAKIGDLVIGETYNRKDPVAGTLLSLTPGPDSCSAMVGFLAVHLFSDVARLGMQMRPCLVAGTEQHGSAGLFACTTFETDYTHCGNLLHVEDAD